MGRAGGVVIDVIAHETLRALLMLHRKYQLTSRARGCRALLLYALTSNTVDSFIDTPPSSATWSSLLLELLVADEAHEPVDEDKDPTVEDEKGASKFIL